MQPYKHVPGRWTRVDPDQGYLRDQLRLLDDHLRTIDPDDETSRVKVIFDSPKSRILIDLRGIGGSLRRLTLRPDAVRELKRELSEGTFTALDRAAIRGWDILLEDRR